MEAESSCNSYILGRVRFIRFRLIKVTDERKTLFESSLATIVEKLAEKFRSYIKLIISKDITSFIEFHKWMAEHK